MFYCLKCAEEREWPKSFRKSLGICEVCGVKESCFDIPSSLLTTKSKKEKHRMARILVHTIDHCGDCSHYDEFIQACFHPVWGGDGKKFDKQDKNPILYVQSWCPLEVA